MTLLTMYYIALIIAKEISIKMAKTIHSTIIFLNSCISKNDEYLFTNDYNNGN